MLDGFIPSKTRVNILVRLFLDPDEKAYLRQLATEFQVSTNSVRIELNHLKEHGILKSEKSGRNVLYKANPAHPLFPEISSMVRKVIGIDRLASSVAKRLGELEKVYLAGDYVQVKDTGVIDLILVGSVDPRRLADVVRKTERYIQRKIRPLVTTQAEYAALLERGAIGNAVLLWQGSPGALRGDSPGTEVVPTSSQATS